MACQQTGPGSLACGEKVFADLIYSLLFIFCVNEVATLSIWFFFIQGKRTRP